MGTRFVEDGTCHAVVLWLDYDLCLEDPSRVVRSIVVTCASTSAQILLYRR